MTATSAMRATSEGTGATPSKHSARTTRAVHHGQRQLLLASVGVLVGSFLPWVETGLAVFGGFAGAGLYTFYAGVFGFAGGLVPSRKLAAGQAVVMATAAIVLPAWQVARLLARVGFSGWYPGVGLVIVFVSGILAAHATANLCRKP